MKVCSRCFELKPLDDYQKERKSSDGRNSHCKVCERIRAQAYYDKHAEERRAYARRYGKWCRQQRRERAVQVAEANHE